MKPFGYFLFLFFNIFQFQFIGIELSLVYNFFILLGLFLTRYKLSFNNHDVYLIMLFVAIFLFSSVTIVFSTESNVQYLLGRSIRLILSTFSILILMKFFQSSLDGFLKILSAVLFLHVVSIYIQFIIPESKILFAEITGYSKNFLPIRAFGLVNSYDTAGLLSILSLVIFFHRYLAKKSKILLALVIFSFISCFLISRFTILIVVLIVSYLIIKYRRKIKLKSILLFSPLFILILFFTKNFIFKILMSVPLMRNIFPGLIEHYSVNLTDSYSNQSLSRLTDEMIVFPDIKHLLFGLGVRPPSDIGYLIMIYLYGIVGTILIFTVLLIIIKNTFVKLEVINNKEAKVFNQVFVFIVFLLFVFNFKGLFFVAKIGHELLLLFILSVSNYYYSFKKGRIGF